MTARRSIWTILISFCLFFASISWAEDMSSSAYFVEDLKSHKIIASKESRHYFPPESTLKNYTAAAALLVLGPDFKYQTKLFFDLHAIHQNTLTGQVTIEFSGDPLFTGKHLNELLQPLKSHGVREIDGDIVLATGAFDDRQYADGLAWDHRHICYSGAINSLNIDRNCFLFHVFPTQEGRPVDVAKSILCSERAFGEACVINHATTSNDKNCALNLDEHHNQYTLSGCISPHTKSQRMTLTIQNTTLYTEALIKKQLQKMGIAFHGHVVESKAKPKGTPLAIHYSLPLHALVNSMLKMSDNLIANSLFKTTGAYHYHAQGTWMRGSNAEKEILGKALGVNDEKLFIYDGSGLSYYNAVTPEQEVLLLKYIQKSPVLANNIIKALPISGIDGTLSGRLSAYPSYVHAKTGSRRDVSALAGYVIRYNTLWAFSAFSVGMPLEKHANADQVDKWLLALVPSLKQNTSKTKVK